MVRNLLIGLGALLLVAGLVCWQERSVRRRVARSMIGRKKRSAQEFGDTFFAGPQAEIAGHTREMLSRHFQLDLSRLHPDDRFTEDLQLPELDSLAVVNLVTEIEQTFGIRIPEHEAARLNTVRALVLFVASALDRRHSQPGSTS
jgi:acyl carrier protein